MLLCLRMLSAHILMLSRLTKLNWVTVKGHSQKHLRLVMISLLLLLTWPFLVIHKNASHLNYPGIVKTLMSQQTLLHPVIGSHFYQMVTVQEVDCLVILRMFLLLVLDLDIVRIYCHLLQIVVIGKMFLKVNLMWDILMLCQKLGLLSVSFKVSPLPAQTRLTVRQT